MIALLAAAALANPALSPSDRARFSLWDGQAPVALADNALEREASEGNRGFDGADQKEELKDAVGGAPNVMAIPGVHPVIIGSRQGFAPGAAAAAAGEIFVSVQVSLDPSLGPLKDALTDLGTRTGFRPDARFEPMFLGAKGDRAAVWGWIAPGRVGEVLRIRGVERVEVSRNRLRAIEAPTRGRYVVGIRLRAGDETPAPQVFARVVRELGEVGDFRWRRTIGYQPVPASPDLALIVVGDAPVRSLGALMGHADVVKIRPLADSAVPETRPAAPAEPKKSFLDYSLERAPQLIGITALLVFLTLRRRKGAI